MGNNINGILMTLEEEEVININIEVENNLIVINLILSKSNLPWKIKLHGRRHKNPP